MSEKIERLNGIKANIAKSTIILMKNDISIIKKIKEIKKLKRESIKIIEYELFIDEITYEFLDWLYKLVDNSIYSNPEILNMFYANNTRHICIFSKHNKYDHLTIKLISYNIVEVDFKSKDDSILLDDFKFQFVISTKFNTDEMTWTIDDRNRNSVLWIIYNDMILPFINSQFPSIKTIVECHIDNKKGII